MSDDTIHKIKERADALALFNKHFPGVHRARGNMVCPFHADSPTKPSLSYVARTKKFTCHGACARSWDIIDLYGEIHGCDNKESIKRLAEECGIARPPKTHPPSTETKKKAAPNLPGQWEQLKQARLSPAAIEYFDEKRKLGGLLIELTEAGMIGFDPKWRQYFPNPDDPEKMLYSLKEAIAFPVTDVKGITILGIQKVPIDGTEKRFVQGSESRNGFFRFGKAGEHTIITEAVIDALSVYKACKIQQNIQVVSIYSAGQCQKVKEIPGIPTLFLDNDFAGIKATIRVLMDLKVNVRLVNWDLAPEGCKDANKLLQEGFAELIERMVVSAGSPKDLDDVYRLIKEHLDKLQPLARNAKESAEVEHLVDEWRRMTEGKEPEDSPLVKRIKEMNKHYAVLMVGSKCLVMQETFDPTFERQAIQFISFQDLKNINLPETFVIENGRGREKPVDIGTLWFHSPLRRQYQGIYFDPGQDHPGFFNLYRGFDVQPKPGKWDRFQEHIFSVIAGKDNKAFTYIIAWMAHLFQQPGGKRPGVSIVLRGDQGTGKGCFVSQLGKIIGQHYMHVQSQKQLTGRFNSHLKDALLVFCDEGVWGGDRGAEGTLKAMITEEVKPVEAKGKDVIMVRNHVRLVIASNNEWVVPVGKKERRFCMFDVLPTHVQDSAYFGAIHEEMNNGGREAMLHDLLGVDIATFDFGDFPKTKALEEQFLRSLSTIHNFWHSRLSAGTLLETEHHWNTDICSTASSPTVITQKLYDAYVLYGQKIGDRYLNSDAILMRSLKKICPRIEQRRIHTPRDGRRVVYTFPPLKECRDFFSKESGFNFTWPQDED